MYKKLILIFIVLILLIFSVYGQENKTYEIETSKGIKVLEVPENMTLEDAYIEMAKLYIETDYLLNESLDELDNIKYEYENYVQLNNNINTDYQNLINKYDNLTKEYNSFVNKLRIICGIGAGSDINQKMTFNLQVGIQYNFAGLSCLFVLENNKINYNLNCWLTFPVF